MQTEPACSHLPDVHARLAPPATVSGPLRLRYWPCIGIWPLIVTMAIALPVAYWARREARFPSTVVCTTARGTGREPWEEALARPERQHEATCSAHDAHVIRTWTQLPCSAAGPALEGLLEAQNPFSRPFIYVTETAPAADDALDTAIRTDDSGGVDAATARALLDQCTGPQTSMGAPRTVQILVLERDYQASALVLAGFFAAALLLGVRRRVLVEVDPTHRFVHFIERGILRERRTLVVAVEQIGDVVVTAGAAGILSGRRVEIVCRDGRVPLTDSFVPLTYGVHQQAARRLRAYVAAAQSTVRHAAGA